LETRINPSKRYQGSSTAIEKYQEALKDGNDKCLSCGLKVAFDRISSFSRRFSESKSEWQWFLVCNRDECERKERTGRYAD
jgi:hypothetical protein